MDFKGLSDPVVIFSNKPEKKNIFDKLRPPSTNLFKGKYLSTGLTVVLMFAIGLGVYLSQKPTQLIPQAAVDLNNGIVAYWKFDETTGSASLDSVSTNNGTAVNTTIVDGKYNKARQIGNSDSYISVPDSEEFATFNLSVAGWIKPAGFGEGKFGSIFNYRAPATNVSGLLLEYAGYPNTGGEGQLQCFVYVNEGPNQAVLISTEKLISDIWNHVACAYDGTTAKLFINGVVVKSANLTGTIKHDPDMQIKMGQNLVNNVTTEGAVLDEIAVWNRGLTDEEVLALSQGALPTVIQPSPSPSPSYVPGFCSSDQDCPNGYSCPNLGPLPSGVSGDPICTPTSPSPSSSASPQASPSPSASPNPLTAKPNLIPSQTASSCTSTNSPRIHLAWTTTPGASSYKVEKMNAGNTAGTVLSETTTTTYNDDTVTASTVTSYRIVAFSAAEGATLTGDIYTISVAPCSASTSPSPSPVSSNFPQGKGDGDNNGVDLADLSILFTKWSPAVNISSHFQLDFDDNLRINSIDRAYMVELLISKGLLRR